MLTENLPEARVLEAIFRAERENGWLEVSYHLTASGALSSGELSLLEHPDVPVALVVNSITLDKEKSTIDEAQSGECSLGSLIPGGT
jgi:hypothetical protein